MRKKFYQTRSVLKKNGCAKAQQTKPLLIPFAIVAKTSSAKVKPIQLFDAETICSADLKNACHLQPKVGDPADTYSNKLGGKYNHQLIVIHTSNSPLLRERVRVRGQSKTSFPFQIGKEVGVNKIGLLSLLQAWKWGVKYD